MRPPRLPGLSCSAARLQPRRRPATAHPAAVEVRQGGAAQTRRNADRQTDYQECAPRDTDPRWGRSRRTSRLPRAAMSTGERRNRDASRGVGRTLQFHFGFPFFRATVLDCLTTLCALGPALHSSTSTSTLLLFPAAPVPSTDLRPCRSARCAGRSLREGRRPRSGLDSRKSHRTPAQAPERCYGG